MVSVSGAFGGYIDFLSLIKAWNKPTVSMDKKTMMSTFIMQSVLSETK
ncbi:MAG: hypothetical protein K2I80_04310 [Ruminococcus sp.]|nr:hypothetical protein [Ruminococcus sp.]MDE6848475.1 hypothetical protein [Ruminococcus sp.]